MNHRCPTRITCQHGRTYMRASALQWSRELLLCGTHLETNIQMKYCCVVFFGVRGQRCVCVSVSVCLCVCFLLFSALWRGLGTSSVMPCSHSLSRSLRCYYMYNYLQKLLTTYYFLLLSNTPTTATSILVLPMTLGICEAGTSSLTASQFTPMLPACPLAQRLSVKEGQRRLQEGRRGSKGSHDGQRESNGHHREVRRECYTPNSASCCKRECEREGGERLKRECETVVVMCDECDEMLDRQLA